MKAAIFALTAIFALLCGGCATHTKEQLAAVSAAGVSGRTMQKLEHRGVLTPEDLIELKRRGVNDAVPLRQLDKVGVDYVVQRNDMAKLRKAGVSMDVRDALARATERFIYDRHRPFVGPTVYWMDDWRYPPGYPYYAPYNFLGIGYGGYYGGSYYGGDHGDHWHGGHHHH